VQGDDRDRATEAIDRALKQTLGARMHVPRGQCIHAETLAAWTEGKLPSDTAASVEVHLSDCTRCQHLLATFARTAPAPAAPDPLWRRWRLQWLVPIATAATAVAIWVAAPSQKQPAIQPPIADQGASAPERAPARAAEPPRFDALAVPQASNRAARQEAQAPTATAPSASTAQKSEEFEQRAAQGRVGTSTAVLPAAAAEADAKARDEDNRGRLAETAQVAPAAPPAQAQAAAAPPAPATPAAEPPAAAKAAPSAAARLGGTTRALVTGQFSPQPDIVSPNPANRWRIIGGRQIERSTDGGARWEAVPLTTTSTLSAGSSPAPSVCWIVGRAGAVYVTSEGRRFTRVAFPETVDLTSVTATDDRHATVMSADGRSFHTDNQGATWTR